MTLKPEEIGNEPGPKLNDHHPNPKHKYSKAANKKIKSKKQARRHENRKSFTYLYTLKLKILSFRRLQP